MQATETGHASLLGMTAMKVVLALSASFLLSGASAVHQHPRTEKTYDAEEAGRRLTPSHIHQKLSEAILEDVLPPISPTCDAIRAPDSFKTTFNFTFSSSHATSAWNPAAVKIEQHAFLVEMSNNDTSLKNMDQAWTMRLARGGNIYSFVGAYGEAIPPQMREGSPWVDEVWQTVAVNTGLNGEDGQPYYIHQAGTYDGRDNLKVPFYSPTIAVHCSGHSCAVAAWGQQAHIPTKFESSIVYINRYTNCNHGVVEVTSLIHNFGDHEDKNDRMQSHEVNFLNVPWAGVRASTLPDMLMSAPPHRAVESNQTRNANLSPLNPIPMFGDSGGRLPGIEKSGGCTVFAQDHYHHEDDNYNQTDFNLPCGVLRKRANQPSGAVPCRRENADPVRLVIRGKDACQKSFQHSKKFGSPVIFCNIKTTVEMSDGCSSCSLKFINRETGANFPVTGVLHWAFVKTRLYFVVDDEVSVKLVNHIFKNGDEIHVERYESGVHHDDALALAFVHGRDVRNASGGKHPQISSSLMRFGRAAYSRDFIVFVVIIRALVKTSRTFVKRHYVVTDRLHAMQDERLDALSDDVYHDLLKPADYKTGRNITLFGTSDQQWFSVALDESEKYSCSNLAEEDLVEVCHGWTTPHEGSTKLLYIRCANESHVGDNFYHFSDDDATDGNIRPYICGDAAKDRPEVLWLGFFPRGECDTLVDAKMNASLCNISTETGVEVGFPISEEPEMSDPDDTPPDMGKPDDFLIFCGGNGEPCWGMSQDRKRVRHHGVPLERSVPIKENEDYYTLGESSAASLISSFYQYSLAATTSFGVLLIGLYYT